MDSERSADVDLRNESLRWLETVCGRNRFKSGGHCCLCHQLRHQIGRRPIFAK